MRKLTGHDVTQRLQEAGRKTRMVNPNDYMGMLVKVEWRCEHRHIWLATPNDVVNGGTGCPHCAGKAPRDPHEINLELLPRNIRMDISSFKGVMHKAGLECLTCGHHWRAIPTSVVNNGKGCPCCARYGFKSDKPGWLYIVTNQEFLKYGITNDPDRRLVEHRLQGLTEVAFLKRYDIGRDAQIHESHIKHRFGGKFVSKDILPNGHTETLPLHLLDEIKTIVI